jgi:aminoglycoside phosphotransferase (APT) family kinase protein
VTGEESAITQWVENHVGGRVVSVRREGRWRPAWYAEVDRDGRSSWLYVRGDRGHGFSYPIEREAATLRLFERHGIPVPHVHGVMDDPKAIVMDKVPGDRQISGIRDPDGQRAAVDAYLRHLVHIHRIPVADAASAGIDVPVDAADLHLAFHRARSDTYRRLKRRPEPFIEFAMKWLARNVPTHRCKPAIATVDAGQFLVDDGRVTAIYDLELVHVTDPQADLAGLRIRNAFEPLGDLGELFERYTELSGDAVDRATVNFHTVVFALSANQAIAKIRAQSARDWVQYFTWEVSGSLFALSALAEEIGVELRAPAPSMEAPANLLSDSLLSALDLWTAPEDPYERSLALDLIEHARLVLTHGRALDEEHLEDVAALVGRRAATVAAADADLERFVLDAGPEHDPAILALLLRRAERQRQLIPTMPADTSAAGAIGPHIDKCYLAPVSSSMP